MNPNPPSPELDRRLVLGGLGLTLSMLLARVSPAHALPADRTTTSPEGIIRTLLERSVDDQGNVFELILDTFPPGITVPLHHHATVGLNYVLSGTAESQYAGQPMQRLKAGDSFTDLAEIDHVHFRNPDPNEPLKILIAHILKPGQTFFVLGPA